MGQGLAVFLVSVTLIVGTMVAMLLFAALARLDLWSVFQGLGATTGPARRFGWAQTVAAIVFCFTLRFRSIEDWKNGRRRDLGVLIGEPGAPSVLSLRTKIKALTESVDPVAFSRAMFKRYLALEPVWEGLYYVDGHFCPYYGEHPTPRGWDAKRGLAVKGHNDVYLHDAKGRALFFFSQPFNDSLGRAIPAAIATLPPAGAERFYQCWYRSVSGPCGTLSNISNGVQVIWTP